MGAARLSRRAPRTRFAETTKGARFDRRAPFTAMEKAFSTNADQDDSPALWLPVAEAAARLSVSPKTVWRRAKSGQLEARKVASGRGGFVWEIALEATGRTERTPTARPDKSERTPHGQSDGAAPASRSESTGRPDKSDRQTDQTATGQPDEITTRLLAHLERESEFLRATVEQHQRSEAELRAALREALKAQPQQLAAPAQSARIEQQRPQNIAVNTNRPTPSNGAQIEAQGEEMDADELLELCRRISR